MDCEKKKVCVIGAGPAGMIALKHLSSQPDKFEPTAFERNSQIGGTWVYTEKTGVDEYGLPIRSPMYRDLEYCFIACNFQTLVHNVTPVTSDADSSVMWKVTYSDVRSLEQTTTQLFHAVCVCNGNTYQSYTPDIEGAEDFKGRILHSIDYRYPEEFNGQVVAVVGGRASAIDLAIQIEKMAEKVYICYDGIQLLSKLDQTSIEHCPSIERLTTDSAILRNNDEIKPDVVLYCTGYEHSFPFLGKDMVQDNNGRITPLYKHFIHIKFPRSLFFFSICKDYFYGMQLDDLAKLAVRIMADEVQLPPEEEMTQDSDEEFESRLQDGISSKNPHLMVYIKFRRKWNEDIANLGGGFQLIPNVIYSIWHHVSDQRKNNVVNYRKFNYKVIDSENFDVEMIKE